MSLPLNPDVMRAAYAYLTTTMPFVKWNLPDAEEVKFKVIKTKQYVGQHIHNWGCANPSHIIECSTHYVGRTVSLMELMAHEMIHLHQRETKTYTPNVEHNKAFFKLVEVVCKYHGFDPKTL